MKQSLLTLGFITAFALAASGNTVIRNYQPLRHDRFYTGNDKAFVGDPYDFSGVGFTGTYWATLISDCYFISATHHQRPLTTPSPSGKPTTNPAPATPTASSADSKSAAPTSGWAG